MSPALDSQMAEMASGGSSMMMILIALTVLSMSICYVVASKRAADTTFWLLMGAIIGPLAVPLVFFSKPVSK